MSYQEYVVIEISQGAFGDGKRRYILVDGDHYSTACTFSTAPQGPLFTVEELKQRLEGWKYVGIEKNLIEEKLEQAFRHGREPIAS